jgi:hypothetical protein
VIPLRREILPPSWSSERRAGGFIPIVVAIFALVVALGNFLAVLGVVGTLWMGAFT